MKDSSDQEAGSAGRENDEIHDFEIEISDLPPDRRSHFLLLRLIDAKRRGQAAARTLARTTFHTLAAGVDGDADRNPQEDEQFALEMSDLPPSTRSHYLLLKLVALKARMYAALPFLRRPADRQRTPLTRARRRARIGRALTAFGLCAVLLLLLGGNLPGLRAQLLTFFRPPAPAAASSTGIYSSISVFPLDQGVPVIVERHGLPINPAQGTPGPLPTVCPQASNLEPFMTPPDPTGLGGGLSGGLGGGPLWLTGFAGPTAALVSLQPLGTSLSQGRPIGWYEGLTVFMLRSFLGTVRLQGTEQDTGQPVFFAGSYLVNFRPIITLNPDAFHPETAPNGSEWLATSITLIIPSAGCYTLGASWPGGSWTEYFAAGA